MKNLTFADTLYPENAEAHIDPRNESSNPWGTVINEFRGDIPVAEPVEDPEMNVVDNTTGTSIHPSADAKVDSRPEGGTVPVIPHGKGCFYLEGILGIFMAFWAIFATFMIELGAAICYCIAAGFYLLATNDDMGIVFKAIFSLVVHALMVCDACLLTTSLLVTEVIGFCTCLVTSIFGAGWSIGKEWHVFVRKICHLCRWAFRGFHDDWKLKRTFVVFNVGRDEQEKRESHTTTGSAHQPPHDMHFTDDVVVVDPDTKVVSNHDSPIKKSERV